ncbi:zinc finger (C3HC4-type RING finger) family protein [Actinidia rufa]|uniref:Zinc finger (C3HC4-type RING finger) family protein n=1 Tax=Actinidia rufa TaxID=165716 RepID=A0A7J0H6Y6_9ERIC|nr:zinc finger (C3HC4-type RING finger) family protein [Actinidia rufa]
MVVGWRRAFCPSVSRDRDSKEAKEKKNETSNSNSNSNPSPRFGSKFAFFSNPSTPRLQSQPVLSPGLRCQIVETASVPTPSAPESPKLQCKTKNSPRFFQRSNPSSPRSPSTFSLLKSSLRIHRSRCRICLHSLKTGQGTAIFTAECSHGFHFPCIAAHLKPHSNLVCPVCGTNWKELPVLTLKNNKPDLKDKKNEPADVRAKNERKQSARPDLKVYNDDEPLMSPKSVTRFNPIPELDENEDEMEENRAEEFQGFFVNASPIKQQNLSSRNVEAMLLPEAAVVSLGRGYETYAVVLKVRAPPAPAKNARRVPIDLVTVLDVGGAMTADKVQMLRRAMRLVVSSLSAADRLSIVAFAAGSKRLLPLRRMTATGRLSAPTHHRRAGVESRDIECKRRAEEGSEGSGRSLRLRLFIAPSRPAALGSGSIRIGNLYATEERELLIELKVPSSATGAHHVLSVRCCHKDPSTQDLLYGKEQLLLVPRPYAVRSSTTSIERLRSLFFTTRAVAESRLLIERNNLSAAKHMLSSARALLIQSKSASANEFIRRLDAELAELQRRRTSERDVVAPTLVDEKGEQLTPTSAWRAAERLAKVAIMRKSMNRVSDLHGFENARF